MKSILLHISGDNAMEARMQAALDMARACDGHITCLQAVNYEVFAPGDFYGSAMAAAIPQIKQAAEELRAKIEADLANEDASWEWRAFVGQGEARLLEQSALHDIVLVGPGDNGMDGASGMTGELAIRGKAPMLVVPADTKRFDTGAPAMVAWNGSAEACVALRRAVPLLARASAVHLVTVEENEGKSRFDFPPLEGARYLARHGIEADVVAIPRGQARIADTLFSAAQMRECGMIVMGAYGHSRLAEMLFGGVTRHSLTDPQVPMFMAH